MEKEQYIKKAEKLCDKYGFEIVENPDYKGAQRSRIHLRCKDCGHKFYWTTTYLNKHMRCPNCKRKYSLMQKEAENIVNKKCKENNYTLVNNFKYVGTKKTQLLLKCNNCGAVKITYFDLFANNKSKCKLCDMEIIRKKVTNTDMVIEKCKKRGYTLLEPYEYKAVQLKNIKLKCDKCGHKWSANYHNFIEMDSGCMICSKRNRDYKKALTTETFIQRAREIHGDKYSYTNVKYKSSDKKVCINCRKHGFFYQLPSSHLNGCGCAKCAIENRKK